MHLRGFSGIPWFTLHTYMILAAGLAMPLRASGQDSVEILRIRAEVQAINADPDYDVLEQFLWEYAVEGTSITFFLSEADIRKVVVFYRAEWAPTLVEYYLQEGEPIFIFRRVQLQSQMFPDRSGFEEDRFWISEGELIQWMDHHGRLALPDQDAARRELQSLTERLQEFLTLVTHVSSDARARRGYDDAYSALGFSGIAMMGPRSGVAHDPRISAQPHGRGATVR